MYNDILENRSRLRKTGIRAAEAPPWKAVGHRESFIGREEERRQIGMSVKQALSGKTTWIAIKGEAGIGKTALVNNTLAQFKDENYRILQVQCHEATRDIPYLTVIDSLRPITREAGMTLDKLEIQPVWHPILAYLLPELLPTGNHDAEQIVFNTPAQSLAFIQALISTLEGCFKTAPDHLGHRRRALGR